MGGALKQRAGQHGLSRSFWRFFLTCLFFDVGFGLYFFLINLFLAARNIDERTIGFIAGALTAGNIIATVPVGWLARRIGLRPLLLVAFVVAPLLAGARVFTDSPAQQICLAMLQGGAMCCYTVCFPPALARLTTEDSRTAAFSFTFAAGIGSGAMAGLVGGWLPVWFQHFGTTSEVSAAMRLVLLIGCFMVICGIPQLLQLRIPEAQTHSSAYGEISHIRSFLLPFLIAVAVWSLATGAFAPFANLYLSGVLHVPLPRIGLIFSASQLMQVLGASAAPLLYRAVGVARGIGLLQLLTAASFLVLAHARHTEIAVSIYLVLMCSQYSSSPGIYSLAMARSQPHQQSSVSAWQNLVSCIAIAASAALAGAVITRFGYGTLLTGTSALALLAAACFVFIDFFSPGVDPSKSGQTKTRLQGVLSD